MNIIFIINFILAFFVCYYHYKYTKAKSPRNIDFTLSCTKKANVPEDIKNYLKNMSTKCGVNNTKGVCKVEVIIYNPEEDEFE